MARQSFGDLSSLIEKNPAALGFNMDNSYDVECVKHLREINRKLGNALIYTMLCDENLDDRSKIIIESLCEGLADYIKERYWAEMRRYERIRRGYEGMRREYDDSQFEEEF